MGDIADKELDDGDTSGEEGQLGDDQPVVDAGDPEPLVAVFLVPMETPLAIPDGSTFLLGRDEELPWIAGLKYAPTDEFDPESGPTLDGHNYVSFRVWQVENGARPNVDPLEHAVEVSRIVFPADSLSGISAEMTDKLRKTGTVDATVVEAVTPLLDPDEEDVERVLRAWVRVVESLGKFVEAYSLITRDVRVTPITEASVYGLVIAGVRSMLGPPGVWGPVHVLLVNDGSRVRRPAFAPLPPSEFEKLAVVVSRANRGDPLIAASRRLFRGEHAMATRGDTSTAVIEAQVACEGFLDQLLLLMAWEEGRSPEEVAVWFADGLAKRVRTHYGSRLGTNWDTANSATPVGKWHSRVYVVRNRVIHAGYVPTDAEAMDALEVAHELIDFMKERLLDRQTKYRRTMLLILGKPGLERRGAMTKKVREFIDTVARSEPDWIVTYRQWLDQVSWLLPQT